MICFTKKEKALARSVPYAELQRKYERSEQMLDRAARRGDLKAVGRAMKEHHTYEYAILCKKAKKY